MFNGRIKLLLLIIMLAVIITGCFNDKEPPIKSEDSKDSSLTRDQTSERKPFLVKDQETVVVYFATLDGKNLVPVTLSINPTKEVAKIAVEKLLAGPENNFSKETIPEGTKLKDIYLQDRTVVVDFTDEIKQVSEKDGQLAIDSLVMTLTEFKEVDDVQILINGQVQKQLDGIDIDQSIKRRSDINLYKTEGKARVRVFFSDANAVYLVPVTLNVPGTDLPLAAMKKLIVGPPAGSGLIRTVWPGTRVKFFSVQNGIATVDFSPEVLGYGGGTTAESMLINSVVLTLTQFEEIETVQLLFDGKKLEYLPEGSDVSSPISAPDKINWIQF